MRKHLLCGLFLFFASVLGQPAAALQVTPSPFDFGIVALGETASREFRLTNRQNRGVHLFSISLRGNPPFYRIVGNTCGDLLAESAECLVQVEFAPLAAGSWTAELAIVSDENPFQSDIVSLQGSGGSGGSEPPAEPPPAEPPVEPPADDPPVLTGIEIRDSVNPPGDRSLPFGEVPVGLAKRKVVRLINRHDGEIEITALAPPQAPFSIENDNCSRARLGYLYSCSVEVVFTPSTLGERSSTLVFRSTLAEEPSVAVALSASGVAARSDFPAPQLIYPEDRQPNMKDSVLLRWYNCRDGAGNLPNYRVHVGKVLPLPEAATRRVEKNLLLSAGFGLAGFLVLRRRKTRRLLLPLILLAALFAACSEEVEDSSLTTVSQLDDETTYYWQVVAEYEDGIENRSEIRSFSTR